MDDKRIVILNNLLSQIEKTIPLKTKINITVSKADVGWQLDHSLKVINRVCAFLEKTKPSDYKKNFNMRRSILFPFGWFPRGKVKAPQVVVPPDLILEADLYAQLESAKTHIKKVASADEKAFFIHHIFGVLSKSQTLRFLEMHTKHHIKIVNDILKV